MSLPPGPPKNLRKVIGQTRGSNDYYLEMMAEYGPVFSLDFGQRRRVSFIGDPGYIKELFTTQQHHVLGNNTNLYKLLGENSLFALTGEEHIRARRAVSQCFFGDKLEEHLRVTEKAVIDEVETWPSGKIVRTKPMFLRLYLKAIQNIIFGLDREAETNELMSVISDMLYVNFHANTTRVTLVLGFNNSFTARLNKSKRAWFNSQIIEMISKVRNDSDAKSRKDMLSNLVCFEYDDGSTLSDAEIIDHIMTVIVAGHETNANQTSLLIELLAHHPEEQELLAENLDNEDAYERAVKESFRIDPTVRNIQKLIADDFDLLEFSFKAKDLIMVSPYLVHMNQEVWENPHKFDPKRFRSKVSEYAWLPFGTGVHRCLGARMVPQQISITARELLRRFVINPAHDKETVVTRGVISAPKYGGEVLVADRK